MKSPRLAGRAKAQVTLAGMAFALALAWSQATLWGAEPVPVAPKVIAASAGSTGRLDRLELGDRLVIEVTNLAGYVEGLRKENKDPRVSLVPYLKGMPLNGIYPEAVDTNHNRLRFHLRREQKSRDAWAALLGGPCQFQREISVSVGTESGGALPTSVEDGAALKLVVVREGWLWTVLSLSAAVLFWFFIKARTTAMLRDLGPDPGEKKLRPYSLAKCQMAWWFVLTLVSFLFIFAVTGAYDSIPGSVFVLMGISAATGLGVLVQNAGKDDPVIERRKLENEARKIEMTDVAERTPAESARLKELQKYLFENKPPPTPASEGFGRDILTDAQGVSFHRFQMAVWTVVLGVIFLVEVWRSLAMPEFNGTLLALMGISSGTYLGFMIPEKHSSNQQAAAGAATPPPKQP